MLDIHSIHKKTASINLLLGVDILSNSCQVATNLSSSNFLLNSSSFQKRVCLDKLQRERVVLLTTKKQQGSESE